jgi:hypothetical protein
MHPRAVFALAVAPLAATALLWSLMSAAREPLSVAFLFSGLAYAYIVAGVLVVPASFLISARNLHAAYGNAVIGGAVGLVPGALLYFATTELSFVLAIVVASAFGGLVFGLIAGRDLTVVAGDRGH